jgi:hypothetical protein
MLHVPLSPDTEQVLRERARAHGEDAATYAARLIKDGLNTTNVEELLAPFREQVDQSGLTDAELDEFGETLREEVWQQQQAKKSKTA